MRLGKKGREASGGPVQVKVRIPRQHSDKSRKLDELSAGEVSARCPTAFPLFKKQRRTPSPERIFVADRYWVRASREGSAFASIDST